VLRRIGELVLRPGAMAIDGKVAEYNVLGDAVHAFFAADVDGLTLESRVQRARRLLSSASLLGAVRAEALVEASERLTAFVKDRWPGAVWRREVAVDAVVSTAAGDRRIVGTIDLLLETSEGLVIVDHKTFPGRVEGAWRAKVVEFLPQFAAYAAALRTTRARPVRSGWVHLPAGGAMVQVST
jgi:ATP-dependent helicase/nuclease subunit A